MPKVYIDGTEYEVREGRNMLEAALDHGLNLPYFCWHPAMGSVGACRLCAVRVYRDESDTKGRIQMACMTPAAEGTRMSMNDEEAVEFRRYVIEWLMVNHPHDCPVCDEGGECHLQDMTAMCGHVYRRYRFDKRTYTNQYLGPFVNHELNRCIQCYRCVRYYRDLAGGRDLNVFGIKNRVYFGRQEDGVLESEFSGNLVEICPTGVFTDKTYDSHYVRKWDLQTAPSVCIHCGLGCNTIPGERYDTLRRVTARFNREVNGYFLCDRGRYGYEFVNSEKRLREARIRTGNLMAKTDENYAVRTAAEMIKGAKGVVGIGSPRASLEANYALRKLVGDDNFSTGLSDFEHNGMELALQILADGPARTPSLAEIEDADVILVVGADPTNEAPMLDFAVRQAMRKAPLDAARKLKIPDWDANAVGTVLQNAKGKLYVAAPWQIKIEEICGEHFHGTPSDLAEFVSRVNDTVRSGWGEEDSLPARIARDLVEAHRPLVVTSVSAGPELLQAAANIAWAICEQGKDCPLSVIVPEANTMGVAMMGGVSIQDALAKMISGKADTLIVLENDLTRRAKPDELKAAMDRAKNLIVMDSIVTSIAPFADVVLATPAWVETNGTFVNNECRAQRFFQVFIPDTDPQPAWKTIQEMGTGTEWQGFEDVLRNLAAENAALAPAVDAAPHPDWRAPGGQKIARMPHRYTGRTAKYADKTVWEPQSPADQETPFAFTMEGDQNQVPAPLVPRFWSPGWNSESAINKFQIEVGGPMHGGPVGIRLIETASRPKVSSGNTHIKPADRNEVWIIPRPRIFGSEELSRLAPAIAEMTKDASMVMHPALAAKLGLQDGQTAEIEIAGKVRTLKVSTDESVADGVVSVPAHFPETVGILEPVKSTIGRGK